jgi:hypothetical protein
MKSPLRSALAVLTLASVASGGDIRHEVSVVANPSDDYLSICGWEFDVDGSGYSTCEIDLDGDGLLDQMFANAATSGTGGQAATVYLARKDGRFTRIGTLGHGGIAKETIKHIQHKGFVINNLSPFATDSEAFILMSAIIYIIGIIFKKGIELQNENELTI